MNKLWSQRLPLGAWLSETGQPLAGVGGSSTHVVFRGVPPLLHVHHGGILHAVGEHLPHKASGAPRRLHLLIPAGFRLLLPLHGSLRLRATPAPRASRHRDSRRPQLRLPGRRLSRRARGLRAPQAAPVGLPRAPSLPRRRAPLACPLSLPPGGAGGNWRRRGGLGVCPAARVRGGGPACCQRAGEGPAAPLGRARAPGGSALAGAVGAGG